MSTAIKPNHDNTFAERHASAVAFIDQHQAQHLHDEQLIARCASRLMREYNIPERMAIDAALHALAEVQARTQPAHVDISRSTSHVIHVVDPRDGRTVAFTASELLQIAAAKPDVPADGERLVRLCGRRADLN